MEIDLLNLQPQVISRDLRSKYILLAGREKIGKTEFITQSPDSLVLAFEAGTNAKPGAMVQKIPDWGKFKIALRQLELPEVQERFSVIGIDTVDVAWAACESFICAQNGVKKIGEIPYGGRSCRTKK